MSDAGTLNKNEYIRNLEAGNRLSEKAIRNAISSLGLKKDSRLLDVPCGLGNHAVWIAECNNETNITAVDFSEDQLEYAGKLAVKTGCPVSINFEHGDIHNLRYDDASFDCIWCCDGLWPGSPDTGCLCEQPHDILREFVRMVKPGGTVAVLFWSSQKLLPGYPLLESALNSTKAANIPVTHKSDPDLHFMRTPLWLEQAGLKNIKTETFASDICSPLSDIRKEDLGLIFRLLWQNAAAEASPAIQEQFTTLTDPGSDRYILNRKGYSAFITYSMFTGTVG